jgi:hypothetical protein
MDIQHAEFQMLCYICIKVLRNTGWVGAYMEVGRSSTFCGSLALVIWQEMLVLESYLSIKTVCVALHMYVTVRGEKRALLHVLHLKCNVFVISVANSPWKICQ